LGRIPQQSDLQRDDDNVVSQQRPTNSEDESPIQTRQEDSVDNFIDGDDDDEEYEYEYDNDHFDHEQEHLPHSTASSIDDTIEETDNWKSNKEWWKDPLAMFEDNQSDESLQQEESVEDAIPKDQSALLGDAPPENDNTNHDATASLDEHGVEGKENEEMTNDGEDELTEEAKQKLADKLITPSETKQALSSSSSDVASTSTKTRNRGASISAPLLPALFLPKIGRAILASPPVVQIFVSFAAGKYMLAVLSDYKQLKQHREGTFASTSSSSSNEGHALSTEEGHDQSLYVEEGDGADEEEDYLSEGEIERLEEKSYNI